MVLPTEPLEWVAYLARRHDAELPELKELDSLYQGTAPLAYMHPEILREVGDRIQPVSLGWPMIAADPLEERLDLVGFRYSDDGDAVTEAPDQELDAAGLGADENLRRVWLDNDLPSESQMAHLDALVMRRAYICVGVGDGGDTDSPLVTVESPLEVFAAIDPRTRHPRAALRRWRDDPDSLVRQPEQNATLYLPNETIWYDQGPQGWREIDRDEHQVGEVLMTPLTNRPRTAGRYGASELTKPLLSLSHAANKIATDMMVAAEFHAIPLRALFGIGPKDLVDEQGNRLSALHVIMGRLLAVDMADGREVQAHQFEPSSLANYHSTLNQLAHHTAGLLGLDGHELGLTTDNPASAEAIKAREVRLINRAERRQNWFTPGWKRSQRHVRRIQDGDWDPRARRLEVLWRDAATPTRASAADAATKLFTAKIVPLRQTREDLGYTPGQIRRMEAEDDRAAAADPLATIARGMAEPAGAGGPGGVG
jgi:hypothetical protein